MKRLTNKITKCLIILMILTLLPIETIASNNTGETIIINVKLSPDEDDALQNYILLRDILVTSDGINNLNVILPKNGKYYIDTTGAALKLRSNTTVDLNGSTLVRYGTMLNQNMFQNCDFDGNRNTGSYDLSKNITIKNGIIDGNGSNSTVGVNLLNFGHATNINIINVELKNAYQGHLIELSGCKDSLIKNCTFNGFYGKSTGNNEAIQLDISKTSWNGIYLSDSTVCKNITVESCLFYDYPSGIGNHHTLTGEYHNKNITIVENSFYNHKDYSEKSPAIRCYGFDDSLVKNNIINGVYSDGIKISGGNVDVIGNNINLNLINESSGIYVTYSNSHLYNKNEEPPNSRINEYVTSGEISNNYITSYGKHGISINSSSTIESIHSNKISSGKGTGIYVTRSTVLYNINKNEICNCAYNSSDNKGNGIHITSTSWVKTIQSNIIKFCAEYGIAHYSTKVNVIITDNILSDNKKDNLKVSADGIILNSLENVTNFKAASTFVSSIKLTWDKVSSADGYIIYKYDNAKKTWVRAAKTTTNSNTYTVSKLSAGTTYKFAIKAYKTVIGKEITSASYPQLTTTTNPANVTKASFTSSANSVKMSWSKVSGATGYRVYQYNTSTKKWKAVANIKNTDYTFKNLKAGTSYKFTVRAYKTLNGTTYLSPKYATFTTSTNPATVSFKLTAGSKKATVKWNKVTGATGYKVYYKTSKNGSWKCLKTVSNKTTSYTKTGLTKGKTYYFTVKAYRTVGGKTYNGAYTTKNVKIK